MKRQIYFLFIVAVIISVAHVSLEAQHMQQAFTSALTAGNADGGATISNTNILSDPVYVNSTEPTNSQFTYLSTNNALASITMNGDGVMRLMRNGSGTIYVVRNANFIGSPNVLKVSFDFNAETTGGTSNSAIEVMLGQGFTNSNVNPATTNKHSLFYINTKSPTGTPGTWGVTPVSASSTSSYSTSQKITWVVNNSGVSKQYTAPDGTTETVGNDTYDLWVGNTKLYDEQAATTAAAELLNFEIRIAGGTGTYTVDNLLIENLPALGVIPTVTTDVITGIGQITATGGGNVTDSGSAAVTVRGVCWSTSENPTISNSKTEDGAGLGTFISSLTGLTSGTPYYVRAYATNSVGTAYGNQVSFSTLAGVPEIALSSDNPAVPVGNIGISTIKNPVYKFTLAVTNAGTQLNQLHFTTSGTATGTDFTKFQLWYNTTDQLSTASQIGTDITATEGDHVFTALTQNIAAGVTGYLWITADVAANAVSGRTVTVNAVTTLDFIFDSGNKYGTAFNGGQQTIIGGTYPTDYFRSKISGNWNNASTWESSSDMLIWGNATIPPDSTSKKIEIVIGDTVTVTESVVVDQVVIYNGGVVVINGSPVVFTVANGPSAVDMQVNGLLKVTGTAIASPGPYSVSLSTDAVLNFGSTGIYEHNQNAGAIPVSVWESGSTIMLTGIVSNSPANGNQNFHHVIWNCPAQTSSLNLGWNGITIGGDITVVTTNTGRWQFCAPTTGSTSTVTINGDVTLFAGNLTTNGTSNGNTTIVINHFGNVNVTGGNFAISRGSQGGTGTAHWYFFGTDFKIHNATTQNSNTAGGRFIFRGVDQQNLLLSNVTFGGGGLPIEVDSPAVLNLNSSVIAGSGVFTVNQYGGITTTMPEGFNGNLTNTGTITLSELGNYGYKGTVPQVTGALLPVTVNNLTIQNTTNVTLSGPVNVNGQLTVSQGYLELNGNNIVLGANGLLVESPNATVRGATGKISTTRNLSAPAGVNVGGLGAMLTTASNLGETLIERYHSPRNGNSNSGIARYYQIAPANNTGLNATLRFYYDQSELMTIPENNLILFRSVSGEPNTWNRVGGTVNTTLNYVEYSGINDFSYWTLADSNNLIPVEMTSFTASVINNKALLNWTTATETNNRGFEIERSKFNETSWQKVGFVQGMGSSVNQAVYSFSDKDALTGKYLYRLKQIDFNGSFTFSEAVEIDFGVPAEFALSQNYPNPFNPSTTIAFQLPLESEVSIILYDILGNEVTTILKESKPAGYYSVNVNLQNLSSGIYYYKMSAGSFNQVKKMILVK